MKRFGKLAFCVILAFFCSSSMAWDDLGHQVVAAIAWDQMTPKARAKVIEMFQTSPDDSGLRQLRPKSGSEEEKDHVQFVLAASWADAVERDQRATIYHHANWHYMRLFWSQSRPLRLQ